MNFRHSVLPCEIIHTDVGKRILSNIGICKDVPCYNRKPFELRRHVAYPGFESLHTRVYGLKTSKPLGSGPRATSEPETDDSRCRTLGPGTRLQPGSNNPEHKLNMGNCCDLPEDDPSPRRFAEPAPQKYRFVPRVSPALDGVTRRRLPRTTARTVRAYIRHERVFCGSPGRMTRFRVLEDPKVNTATTASTASTVGMGLAECQIIPREERVGRGLVCAASKTGNGDCYNYS